MPRISRALTPMSSNVMCLPESGCACYPSLWGKSDVRRRTLISINSSGLIGDIKRSVGGIADLRTSQRGKIMFRLVSVCLAFLFATAASAQIQFPPDSRLKAITSTKTIKIAYRADARPFSFVNDKNEPVGFTIDLCRLVANSIGQQFGLGDLKIDWVPTTLQTRFTTVASGKADMECGSSTATLGRMKDVDFSNFVFVESTGIIVPKTSNIRTFADMAGKKIAV